MVDSPKRKLRKRNFRDGHVIMRWQLFTRWSGVIFDIHQHILLERNPMESRNPTALTAIRRSEKKWTGGAQFSPADVKTPWSKFWETQIVTAMMHSTRLISTVSRLTPSYWTIMKLLHRYGHIMVRHRKLQGRDLGCGMKSKSSWSRADLSDCSLIWKRKLRPVKDRQLRTKVNGATT